MFLLYLLTLTNAHSWVECTNYQGNLETFEKDKCLGLPRPLAGNRNVGNLFGQDIGMDYRPPTSGQSPCQGDGTLGLNANYPGGVIEYKAGETITIAWPAKNHAAAECTNANIPDTFLKVFMVPYNQQSGDPTQAAFRQNQVKASFSDEPHVNGVIDLKGFQNCPKFCDNTDKAMCTGTFTVGSDVPPGVYTFQWYWAFNSPADLYSTCWEAQIVPGNGNNNDNPPTTAPPLDTSPCTDCCPADRIIAPGTGEVVDYGNIIEGGNSRLDCPGVYSGSFKLMCLNEEIRIVDGFCTPPSAASLETHTDQSGTVAWLSVALALTLVAFIYYVANDMGLVDYYMGEKHKDVENPPLKPAFANRVRQKSVFTESETVLPVVPLAPSDNWFYVSATGEDVGPLKERELAIWAQKKGFINVQNTLVWNGETVTEWKKMLEVPGLVEQLKAALANSV